jgi:hypothetical protein
VSSLLRAVIVVSLSLGLINPSAAEWSRDHRRQFTSDCVKGCETNPKVDRTRHAECPAYCNCILSEAEAFISNPEYSRLEGVAARRGTDPNLDRLRALYPMCSKRVFGP